MRTLIATLSLTALLLLTGCAGGGQEVGTATQTGADGVELGSGDGAGAAPAGPTQGITGDATAAGAVETVQAGEAGEVDVRVIDGRRLELVEVREAAGWTHTVDDIDDDEIDIDFRDNDGRLLELEIEVDDGRLRSEVR